MSVNKHLPHVLVLPEDDANRQIANGFHLEVDPLRARKLQVLMEAGGWAQVRDQFLDNEVAGMERYPARFMVLIIDSDGDANRVGGFVAAIPVNLRERVFVISTLTEAEDLKPDFGSFEQIGSQLAQDCREDTDAIWGHDLLKHNAADIARLRQHIRPLLF